MRMGETYWLFCGPTTGVERIADRVFCVPEFRYVRNESFFELSVWRLRNEDSEAGVLDQGVKLVVPRAYALSGGTTFARCVADAGSLYEARRQVMKWFANRAAWALGHKDEMRGLLAGVVSYFDSNEKEIRDFLGDMWAVLDDYLDVMRLEISLLGESRYMAAANP